MEKLEYRKLAGGNNVKESLKLRCLAPVAVCFLGFAVLSAAIATPPSGLSLGVKGSSGVGDVLIINTGNRTTPGYQVSVDPNGKLLGTLIPRQGRIIIHRADQMIPAVRRRFFADLAHAQPLNALSVGQTLGRTTGQGTVGSRRRRGASARTVIPTQSRSGVQIFVRYQGQQSPNLRDASSSAGKTLLQDVKQILSVLRLPVPERF